MPLKKPSIATPGWGSHVHIIGLMRTALPKRTGTGEGSGLVAAHRAYVIPTILDPYYTVTGHRTRAGTPAPPLQPDPSPFRLTHHEPFWEEGRGTGSQLERGPGPWLCQIVGGRRNTTSREKLGRAQLLVYGAWHTCIGLHAIMWSTSLSLYFGIGQERVSRVYACFVFGASFFLQWTLTIEPNLGNVPGASHFIALFMKMVCWDLGNDVN